MSVYHVRKPLRKACGNQYYRDYSNRGQGTYCGADCTLNDIGHRDKAVIWNDNIPCTKCIKIRSIELTT